MISAAAETRGHTTLAAGRHLKVKQGHVGALAVTAASRARGAARPAHEPASAHAAAPRGATGAGQEKAAVLERIPRVPQPRADAPKTAGAPDAASAAAAAAAAAIEH